VRNILLTVFGVLFLGFVAFMALGFYELRKNGPPAQAVAAPAGAATQSPAPDLGIPMYPGATITPAGVSTTVNSKGTSVSAVYSTPDAPATVAQFYQQQLGDSVHVINVPGGGVMMSIGDPSNATTVVMTIDKGQTYMNIMHGQSTAR
jgi:hypothetical protein